MRINMSVEQILAERQKTHGSFETHSMVCQGIKDALQASENWFKLTPTTKEALDMIAHKMARIVNGQEDFKDHWDDIAGYATLKSKLIESRTKVKEHETD